MKIKINDKIFNLLGGKEISILGNKLTIDGKIIKDLNEIKEREINITIIGNCDNLNAINGYISISGNVENIKSTTGNVIIQSGNVLGDINTVNGNIKLNSGSIFGNVVTKYGKLKK